MLLYTLGFIFIAISVGNVIPGEEVGKVTVMPVVSNKTVSAVSASDTRVGSDKTDEDDMQTSASTNIQHWINSLASSEKVMDKSPPTSSSTDSAVDEVVTTLSPHHSHHTAEEVADMNKDPYRNLTETHDGGESSSEGIDKGTDTIHDSHVIQSDKSHEENAGSQSSSAESGDVEAKISTESVPKVVETTLRTESSEADVVKVEAKGGAAEVAAILGGVLVGIAVAGYLGLLAWRRLLEKRYGNREILVNEDDDMHNFEL